jgi:hypothetical protein
MGCSGSKAEAPETSSDPLQSTTSPSNDGDREFNPRRSIVHTAPELDLVSTNMAVYAANFDPKILGTITRHGIAPARAAGATSKAKINQDRGAMCWPFNGSHNQALMCVFDGHGMQGERISEHCAQELPARLEADREALRTDTTNCLIRNVRSPVLPPAAPPHF